MSSTQNSASWLVAIATYAMLVNSQVSAAEYTIRLLDGLTGSLDSFAFALNNAGQVVGDSRLTRTGNVADSRPLQWSPDGQRQLLWEGHGIVCEFDPELMQFVCKGPVFSGGTALDVNNVGQIVGRAQNLNILGVPLPSPGIPLGGAFIWDSINGKRDLGTLGGNLSDARGVNDFGLVAGSAENELLHARAFLWSESDGMQDLGTLGGLYSFANGINNLGQVIGYSARADGREHAFIWDSIAGMTDLAPDASFSSRALGVNDLGQVVGQTHDGGLSAFLWDPEHGMQILDGPSFKFSSARAINNLGQIVGEGDMSLGSAQPVIWDAVHGLRDLQSLIPANSGWDLHLVTDINDLGQIVGYGYYDGQLRGFVMSPVPEPSSFAIAVMATSMVLIYWRVTRLGRTTCVRRGRSCS